MIGGYCQCQLSKNECRKIAVCVARLGDQMILRTVF